jgi:thioesterase domain-containing protein/acyl carrier protein
VWREVLGRAEVGPDDAFFQLGGQSLAAVSLLARIERAYSVRLPMSALLARAATPAKMAAVLSAEAEHQDSHLVAIRPEGTDTPVFWLPGGGGLSVLAFREVSQRLGESQPVYGFEAKLSLDDAPESIPEIARRYVEDLVGAFPEGPYLLLGFSFGSWVAFEMGVELRRRGKSVPLLCVFDSPIPVERNVFDRSRILFQRTVYQARALSRMQLNDTPRYLREMASLGARRSRERLTRFGLDVDRRHIEEASGHSVFDALDRKNREAAARYVRGRLPTFDGRITIILAERTSQSAVSPHLDDRLAIGRFATGGTEVHRVPGSHLAMLEPPNVDELACILRACIARSTNGGASRSAERDASIDR